MIVSDIRTRLVSVPFAEPPATGFLTLPAIDLLVVEVETRDGVVGTGHLHPLAGGMRTLDSCIHEMLKPLLIGQDAADPADRRAYTDPPESSYYDRVNVHTHGSVVEVSEGGQGAFGRGRTFNVDVPWVGGMSDGPVLNNDGEVIGVISSGMDLGDGSGLTRVSSLNKDILKNSLLD